MSPRRYAGSVEHGFGDSLSKRSPARMAMAPKQPHVRPRPAAAKTSVGQWTPMYIRLMPTRTDQARAAQPIQAFFVRQVIAITKNAIANEVAECPLGKLAL